MRPFRFSFNIFGLTTREAFVAQCREAEELGYDAVFSADHVGLAAPFAVLVSAAEATHRLALGTLVLNVPFWTPALLAREIATTDILTEGRLIVGPRRGAHEVGVRRGRHPVAAVRRQGRGDGADDRRAGTVLRRRPRGAKRALAAAPARAAERVRRLRAAAADRGDRRSRPAHRRSARGDRRRGRRLSG